MPGRFGRTMTACGWPNLVRIADAALRHYDEICDPAYHYAPYVGASLGWPTPCFNHHRWDWIEVLPYPLIGRIAARRITGYLGGAEIERRQRQLLLSAFHNLDGLRLPALRARLVGADPRRRADQIEFERLPQPGAHVSRSGHLRSVVCGFNVGGNRTAAPSEA